MHYYLDWLADDTQSCAGKVKDPFSLGSNICLKFLVESRKISPFWPDSEYLSNCTFKFLSGKRLTFLTVVWPTPNVCVFRKKIRFLIQQTDRIWYFGNFFWLTTRNAIVWNNFHFWKSVFSKTLYISEILSLNPELKFVLNNYKAFISQF